MCICIHLHFVDCNKENGKEEKSEPQKYRRLALSSLMIGFSDFFSWKKENVSKNEMIGIGIGMEW